MFTIYGHRGMPSKAPENTLASFKAAAEVEGIKWLELDVAITKDEQLVIIHDDDLERTTDMSGEITTFNYDEIKSASTGAWYSEKFKEEKLPTFDEVIELANAFDMNINVELKGVSGPNGLALSHSMVKQVSEKLQNLNKDQQVVISSFNVILVKLASEIMPQYRRGLIFHASSFRRDWQSLLDYCEAEILNIEDAQLTEEKVKLIKEAGYELNVWTVNKSTRANQLANWGVDGIFTNNADKMVHLSKA
ncbi:glycerophosphoryl diester phosphodiesterase [Mammaliicoccus stepanovicii]|uniref:Glycerophosphoryl diester phosphodiesterase n=1 Tax=Mammaliicoccus stepanovicii TaxID=643214 RepID=A0A239Y8Q0_9STAP|nr:glycerophosphoryl diester phosphodiesterase [Mammaliicoccus stepanovicii]PNZ75452.1 glycerophosphoryl diester phosphodiesterase [Mammaliicoccus stepanovicii]GGI43037.1 glycerophosphoryl diester phosphodiesterase [Mammaliicoccus stepanovicii]SNV55621.1 Glycerophosphoryl diester phosphodiesterase [Mammaliicoccus stepanovicii]